MQSLFIYFTAKSLYMFRVSPATIIRSTQAVVTTTGTGQMFEDFFYAAFIYFTAKTLYMFRVSPAPIIRSTQAVVTTTGTGQKFEEFNDKISLKRAHGRAATSLWAWPFGQNAMPKFR